MPRWLVLFAVVGLVFAVMTPSTPAASAATAEAFDLFDDDGAIAITGASDVAGAVAAPDDGAFVQMAPGSSIIMTLPVDRYALPDGNAATSDLMVDIYDALYPAFAEVLLSGDGVNYWSEGFFGDTANINLDLGEVVKYVKIIQPEFCDPGIDGGYCIDQAYPLLGFDLDAVLALNPGVPSPTTSCPTGEYFVDSYGLYDATPVVPIPVIAGQVYDITVSGWFYAGGWAVPGGLATHDIRADAEYSETRYARTNALGWTDTPGTAPGDPYIAQGYAEDYFELLVGIGGPLESVEWGAYETDNTYTIRRLATTGTALFQFQINEGWAQNDVGGLCVSLEMVNQPPVADANGPYTGVVEESITLDGSGSWDPDSPVLQYQWDFGDGSPPIEAMITDHVYSVEGTYTVALTVTDDTGLSDTDTSTVDVGLVPATVEDDCGIDDYFVTSHGSGDWTPTVETESLVAGHEYEITTTGTFYAGGDTIRADAEYSQNKTQRATGVPWSDFVLGYESYGEELLELFVGVIGPPMPVEWGAYNDAHSYTITRTGTGAPALFQFQVYDVYAQNNTGGLCVSVDMLNRPPVSDPNGPYLGAQGESIQFDGTGSSDIDGDPLTFDWDFGDGGTSAEATPTHAYGAAGFYDVCLTVDDGYGGSATECTQAVVYDPAEGFVTGGGWITSPEGAYVPDPLMTGKATFGFVSKYKKGASVPTGNTEFQFHTGDLNFHSTSYDWLVVTGSNFAKFKGEGTINGEGAYKFQIWAGDDEPDTFRIKIWTDSDGVETVVYDNGMNQEIDAGSIIIHTKKK